MNEFEKFKIKDFQYWTLSVHENQGYLGRCIIWCKRENANDLTEATVEEREELFSILKDLKLALEKAFQANWMNYSFLGNNVRHLHCHVLARYSTEREFGGMIFKDERWGKSYRTDVNFKIPAELIEKIRLKISESL